MQAETAQRRARGYRALPLELARAWARVAADQARLVQCHWQGQTVAQMLILIHGTAATYHIGVTTDEGRRHAAHHLMLAQVADWLAARGVTQLDLGPVDTEGAPGLARFKIGSGATLHRTGGSWLRLPFWK